MASLAEQYVLFGLRLGRHADGLVDAYYGPPELKERVDAEPLTETAALVAEGDALLAELADGWLRDQALGLRTYAGLLDGETLSYSDEVERCYGVRPERRGTDAYAAAHERLDELLPGGGALPERYQAWRQSTTIEPDRVVPAFEDAVVELRAATEELVDLPPGERLDVEGVLDEPWWAFNYYLGELRSRVAVNLDVPTTAHELVHLAGHEVYPGHHTEHSVKEQLLLREQGKIEESIQMVPTPSALVGEGIAEVGPGMVWNGELAGRLVEALRRHGVEYDARRSVAIAEARRALRRVNLDAALMIHEDGAGAPAAEAYIRRWSLVTAEEAAHSVRFVVDPMWRAYVITYSAGRELCERWVDGDPARFRRLLTEHIRVGELTGQGVAVRALERLDELYAIGGGPGANRIGYSAEEDAAHRLARGWLEAAGLDVRVDDAGNTFGGADPVWTGSHLDTVPQGGRFDGALGVVAAIEAVERAGRGTVAIFREEERGCVGSRAFVEQGQQPDAFVELHIEQGPRLAAAGAPLAIVTGIVGYARGEVVVEGAAGHAGTTPMELRDDALVKAARGILALEERAREIPDAVATVGQIEVSPGGINVIPGRARYSVDVRAPDQERLDALIELAGIDAARAVPPTQMDATIRSALREAIDARGLPVVELASGAGHDAGVLARAGVPAGMLFVRSLNGGVSHSPDELSSADDIELAIDVLASVLGRLA